MFIEIWTFFFYAKLKGVRFIYVSSIHSLLFSTKV